MKSFHNLYKPGRMVSYCINCCIRHREKREREGGLVGGFGGGGREARGQAEVVLLTGGKAKV